jgi:hypothetical protein
MSLRNYVHNTTERLFSFVFIYFCGLFIQTLFHWIYIYIFIYSFTHSLISQSVLRQVHSLFQSEFFIECDRMLPLSISNVLSFP